MTDHFKDLVLNHPGDEEYGEIHKIIKKKIITEDQLIWLKDKAKQGNSNAQDILGEYYFYEKDYKEAIEQYTLSAEQNNSDGQYNLGYMHFHGKGTDKDEKRAILLFEKSAEQGNCLALKMIPRDHFIRKYCDAKQIIFRLQSEKEIRRVIEIPEVIIEVIASYQCSD